MIMRKSTEGEWSVKTGRRRWAHMREQEERGLVDMGAGDLTVLVMA